MASVNVRKLSVWLLTFNITLRTLESPASPSPLFHSSPSSNDADESRCDWFFCSRLSVSVRSARMVLTKDIWLPTDEELTVEEVPLGTPSLRAGAMHLGKACEVQNNEFMLCRSETQDPRWVNTREGRGQTLCFLLGNVSRKARRSPAAPWNSSGK